MLQKTKALTLTFSNASTYLLAVLFVLGNIVLPQLCHLIPQGGLIFQPIYVFTLIAACCLGWRVALLTAIASPLANALLFAMPTGVMLPIVLIKSVVLSISASKAMSCRNDLQKPMLILAIVGTWMVGICAEWLILGNAPSLFISMPGVALQMALALWITSTKH